MSKKDEILNGNQKIETPSIGTLHTGKADGLKNEDLDNFTIIRNEIIESGLSINALGLYLVSLKLVYEDNFSLDAIYEFFPNDDVSTINSAIKELEEAGYYYIKECINEENKSYFHCSFFETKELSSLYKNIF